MNLDNLQKLIKLISGLFRFIQEHKAVNLVKMGLMLMIFYMLFMEFYVRNRYYSETRRNNIITEKISEVVKGCGQYSFVSWMVLDDTKASFQKNKVEFVDVIGCVSNRNEHCPVSVKLSNKAYLKTYYLGYDDADYLARLDDGLLVSCDLKDGELSCPEYTPNILRKMAKLTNFKLTQVSYVVVRDFKANMIYIFTLSFTDNSIKTCTDQVGNSLLENLARTAKENL